MPIQNMEEMIQAGLDRAVEMMTLAAWNSNKIILFIYAVFNELIC